MYNISGPQDNDSAKLVISVRAGGKPPAGRITKFVPIVFWGQLWYIFMQHIHIYIEREAYTYLYMYINICIYI